MFNAAFLLTLILFFMACENKSPSCDITSPLDNAQFGKGEIIPIIVDAKDPNGNNMEIRFFVNDSGLYSTSKFPYTFNWNTNGFEDGDYLIEASVIDSEGRRAGDSKLIKISVSTPKIQTESVFQISLTSATVGGVVISDGGSPVTETGIYWSNEEDPETTGEKITVTSSLDEFTAAITGLNTNSSYYYRAYAVNSVGEALGEEKGFTTLGNQLGTFVDPRDDREYQWVRIGNHTWMAEN